MPIWVKFFHKIFERGFISIDDRPGIYIYPLIGNSESNPLTNPNARAHIESRMNTYATSPLLNRVTIQEATASIPDHIRNKIYSCIRANVGLFTRAIGLININDNGKNDYIIIFGSEGIVNHDEYRFGIVREGDNKVITSIPFKEHEECLEMSIQRWKDLKILSDANSKPRPPLQKEPSSLVKPADSQRPTEILKEPDGTTTAATESQPKPQTLYQAIEDGSEYAPEAIREINQLPGKPSSQDTDESKLSSLLDGLARGNCGYMGLTNDKVWKNWEKAQKISDDVKKALAKNEPFVIVMRKNQPKQMTLPEAVEYRNQLVKKTLDAADRILADRTRPRKKHPPKKDKNSEQNPLPQKKEDSHVGKAHDSKGSAQSDQQNKTGQSQGKQSTSPNSKEQVISGLLKEDATQAYFIMEEHKRVTQLIDEASKNRSYVVITVNGLPVRMSIGEAQSYQQKLFAQGTQAINKAFNPYKDPKEAAMAEKNWESFKKEFAASADKSQSNGPAQSDPPKKDAVPPSKDPSPKDQPKKPSTDPNKNKASSPPITVPKPASGPLKELQDTAKYASNKMGQFQKIGQQIDEAKSKKLNYITIKKNGQSTRLSLDKAIDKQRILMSKAANAIHREAYKPRTRLGRAKEALKNAPGLQKAELAKSGANNLGSALGTAWINRDKYASNKALVLDVGFNTLKASGVQIITEVGTVAIQSIAGEAANNIPGASTVLTVGHYTYAIYNARNMKQRVGLVFKGVLDTGMCLGTDAVTTPLTVIPGLKGLASGTLNAAIRRYVLDELFHSFGV